MEAVSIALPKAFASLNLWNVAQPSKLNPCFVFAGLTVTLEGQPRKLPPQPRKNTNNTVFDAFMEYQGPETGALLQENHLVPMAVPNNCADCLQPIDLSVNKAFKDHLHVRNKFVRWYIWHKWKSRRSETFDIRLLVMKEIETKYVLSAYNYLRTNSTGDCVQSRFKKAGILDVVEGQVPVIDCDKDSFSDADEESLE